MSLSESAQAQANRPVIVDPQLIKNIKLMSKRFWKQHMKVVEETKRISKAFYEMHPNRQYKGPEIKLFCGHWRPEAEIEEMFKKEVVVCGTCGMSWRGYMVINHRKSLNKKELYEAIRRAREREKGRKDEPKRRR
jgi:hypothetical protein